MLDVVQNKVPFQKYDCEEELTEIVYTNCTFVTFSWFCVTFSIYGDTSLESVNMVLWMECSC